jgi:cytosine/creatinine deaminase
MTRQEIEKLYDMITVNAARAMNLVQYGLCEGARADLVILDQQDVLETLRFHAPPVWVISNGRIVDQARMKAIAST